MTRELFDARSDAQPVEERLADGALLLRGFAIAQETPLLQAIRDVASAAPFRHMETPGGFVMSVAMTSCGSFGWVTDRAGYRYDARDPGSGLPWPAMPELLSTLATTAAARAGFGAFAPDSCLVNRYAPGARMSLHQDRQEQRLDQPVVSLSLGLPAVFQFGGVERGDRAERHRLAHGDVVVWGGPSRLRFHGVLPLADGEHPLVGSVRYNLTFRHAR